MTKLALIVGLSAIGKAIAQVKGVANNLNLRVQQIGESIIAHDIEHGDCTKAKDLVNALRTQEDRRNLTAWFAYFGNIGCKMDKGICTEVKHFPPEAKRYTTPDLAAAKEFNWFEPYDAKGNKAHWFVGPPKPLYTAGTIGDLGENIVNFADRYLGTDKRTGLLYDKVDAGNGTMVSRYNLNDSEIERVEKVLTGLRNIGYALGAREEAEELTARVLELNEFTDAADGAVEVLDNLGQRETVAA